MKAFSSLLLALALFGVTSVAQAITFNWMTSNETWGMNVTGGALIYNASDDVSYNADSLVALAKSGEAYTGFTNVVDAGEDETSWNFEGSFHNTVVVDSGKHTDDGTYFIVLFDEDSKYAIAQFAAKDTAKAWVDDPLDTATFTYYKPSFTGTLVPEPSLLALLALGVAGLALKRRA